MLSIRALTLHYFRNYDFVELDTGGRSLILTGSNGAGKTNILEAISLFSPGRGLRKAKLRDMRQQNSGQGWVVAADIHGFDGQTHLGTAFDEFSERDKRLIKIDGEAIRGQAPLAEHLAISWHTPQMDGLFMASDGERRRYLDRLTFNFDAAHLARVNRYEHTMRERNKLLADGSRDAAWLGALEEVMAQTGVAIAAARREAIERLNTMMHSASDAFPRGIMAMQCALNDGLESGAASQAEEELQDALLEGRGRDAAAGRTLAGPHRSMLHVTHAEKNIEAAYCSTGEQKALLLSILLAHARARKDWLGAAPILLLDETVAHLDEARRAALAEALGELETQVFMTGTDAADFTAFEGLSKHFEVRDGEVVS